MSGVRPRIALIWAMARNRIIGRENSLPWRLPVDMQHFRQLTLHHPVLMGRKTFESLRRPLPDRTNIIISRDPSYSAPGILVAHTIDEALKVARQHLPAGDPQIFVIGGENLYAQMLPRADRLYVTLVDADVDGDARFPEFDWSEWREIGRQRHLADENNPYACTFVSLERKMPRAADRGI
jgi:dihydrofolate reductase